MGARESLSTSGVTSTGEGCEDLVSSLSNNNSNGSGTSRTGRTNILIENHDPENSREEVTSATLSALKTTGTIKGYVKCHAHDILSGRGNGANQHSGNIYFRNLISNYKRKYVLSEPAIKKQITNQVLNIVQGRHPPGRFLRQEAKSGEWTQLDRETALRKTAQALREKAPELKKKVLAEAERKDEQQMMKRMKRDSTSSTSPDLNQPRKRTHKQQDFQASSPSVPSSPTPARRAQKAMNLVEPNLSCRMQEQQVLKEALALERIQAQQQHQQNNAILQAAVARDATNEIQHRNQQYQAHIDRLAMMATANEGGNALQQSSPNVAVILNDAHFMGKTASLNSRQADFFKEQARHSMQQRLYDTSGASHTYSLKYDSVAITVTPIATSPEAKIVKTSEAGKEHYETLKNISIVASTSSALTALYVIVRMSSDALAYASFDKDLLPTSPTEHDVLVDSTDIINHPGNLYLAELIQTHRPDYSSVRCSDEESRLKITDHVITCITKRGSNLSKTDPKRGRFLLSANDAVVKDSARAGRCVPRKWEILPPSVIQTMIAGLFYQACAFILAPETNDVLFGKFDKSMISPGNMFYKMIVAKCRPLYVQSTPDRQYQYAAEIVGFITSRPGRFLGYCEDVGMWMPLPFELAIEKTQEMLDNDASDFIALSREPVSPPPAVAQMVNNMSSLPPSNEMGGVSSQSPFRIPQTNTVFEGVGIPPSMSQNARDRGTLIGANELLALNSIAQHRLDNDRHRNP